MGFSDITVLLSHLLAETGVQSIHGQMPYTFDEATPESLESLKIALFGGELIYQAESTFENRSGTAEGVLIGGNLTLLVMMQGSASEIDYTDKILFIEDVGEHEYSVDRMMRMLKRAGKLAKLKGLIVGAFNEIAPEKIPFGATPEQVIWDVVKEYDYPVCFNFPMGHIDDNRAMIVGKRVKFLVKAQTTTLSFQ
ncbi:putative murein peptide carboxypeptidase [compost metagenome]